MMTPLIGSRQFDRVWRGLEGGAAGRIHAKKHLSRLIEQAAKGEPFIIAKAGKPLVKIIRLNAPEAGQQCYAL
jgi:hypothetical protein